MSDSLERICMKVTTDNVEFALTTLRGCELLAIDTETTGLSETDKAFAVIVANANYSFYFDERLVEGVFARLNDILMLVPARVIMQNAKFDMRMLASIGIDLSKSIRYQIYDITSLARLVRNDHLAYNLDAQASRFGHKKLADMVKKEIKDKNLFEMRTNYFGEQEKHPRYDWVDIDIMAEYAAQDARLTFDLYVHYMRQLNDQEMDLAAGEALLNNVCYDMERRGLQLDVQKVYAAQAEDSEGLELAEERFKELTGKEFVNSGKAIQSVLTLKLPLTDKGNPSADVTTLEELAALPQAGVDAEIIQCILKMREHEKRISTYFRNYLNMKDKDDVIHPQMWIAGTRTGRFSYSEPNLQNIPKEEASTYSVRECFIPREGRVFVSLDYSQMEYRLAADYAGETKVIEAVMNGADFHQATADMVGITRKQAKTLNFAVLYGAGIDKIAGMLGVSVLVAKNLKTTYFLNLPRIEQLIDGVIRTGKGRGHVYNWAGRKLYADPEFAYALPNHLIQSSGADVVKEAMRRIYNHPELGKLWCVLQVHDQLVFELTQDEMKYVPMIKEIMESVYVPRNGIKLTVDVSISYINFAEKNMEKL